MSRVFDIAKTGLASQYLRTAPNQCYSSLSELTYAAWIKPISCGDPAGARYRALLIKAPAFAYNGMWLENGLDLGNGAGINRLAAEIGVYISGNSGGAQYAFGASLDNSIPLGVWTHVGFTFSLTGDRKVHIYINGVPVAMAFSDVGGAGSVIPDFSDGLWMAWDGDFNQVIPGPAGFDGSVAEIGVWNKALSSAEMASLAASSVGASAIAPVNLVGYWHLCGGSPEADSSPFRNSATVFNSPAVGDDPPAFICGRSGTTIVLSPVSSFAAGEAYYNMASEYPRDNSPLHEMRRFILYPWAYNVSPIGSFQQPPT